MTGLHRLPLHTTDGKVLCLDANDEVVEVPMVEATVPSTSLLPEVIRTDLNNLSTLVSRVLG